MPIACLRKTPKNTPSLNDTLEIEYLTQDEIKELYKATYGYNEGTKLETLNARDRAILTVYYAYGLRRSEPPVFKPQKYSKAQKQ